MNKRTSVPDRVEALSFPASQQKAKEHSLYRPFQSPYQATGLYLDTLVHNMGSGDRIKMKGSVASIGDR